MIARNRRTAFLAIVATVTFGWSAVVQFDVPVEELAWLLLYCLIGVICVAMLAGVAVGLVVLIGSLRRKLQARGSKAD